MHAAVSTLHSAPRAAATVSSELEELTTVCERRLPTVAQMAMKAPSSSAAPNTGRKMSPSLITVRFMSSFTLKICARPHVTPAAARV
jgi:hypothetical protein